MTIKLRHLWVIAVLLLTLVATVDIPPTSTAQESETGTISGTIYKVLGDVIPSGTPYANITVLVDVDDLPPWEWTVACTDSNGNFAFTLPYGPHEMIIDWRQPCSNQEVNIALYSNFGSGTPFRHSFTLSPANPSIELPPINLEPGYRIKGTTYDAVTGEVVPYPQMSWGAYDTVGNRIANHWTPWLDDPNQPYTYVASGIPYGQNIHLGALYSQFWVDEPWPYLTEYWNNIHSENPLDATPINIQHSEYLNSREFYYDFYLDKPSPPDCTQAVVSPDFLWPPEHQMVPITITVPDTNGQAVAVTITAIWQDEPTNGTGDGDTAPDATGIGTHTAVVRAERDGAANGRMYHIYFTASAGNLSCSGEIMVGVLNNMGKRGEAIDDGALYDATLP